MLLINKMAVVVNSVLKCSVRNTCAEQVRGKMLVEKCITRGAECPVRDMISIFEQHCVPLGWPQGKPNGTPNCLETFIFYQYQIPNGILNAIFYYSQHYVLYLKS